MALTIVRWGSRAQVIPQSSGPQTQQKGRPPHSPGPSHIWGVPNSSLGTAFKSPAMPAGLPKETDLGYSMVSFHGETGDFHKPQPLSHPPWGTPNQLPQPLTYLEIRRDQSAGPCKQPIRTNERERERALSTWLGYSELSKFGKLSGLGKQRDWEDGRGSLYWERASMVGQRQLGSWASIPGQPLRLGLWLHNGSRPHLSSLLALKLLRNLFGSLLNPRAQTSCAHKWM